MVTITKVDTSKDLRHAKVFASVFPENEAEYALKTMKKERGAIQRALNKKLYMKPLPEISFVFDPTESGAQVIEDLLQAIHEE